MRALILFLAALASATAQRVLPFEFDPALTRYLELSDTQRQQIELNNRDQRQADGGLQLRINQLWQEAQRELRQPSPDPMIVGTRHADLQRACREQETAARQTRERNLAVLTETQRRRLTVLQEAARLSTVIAEAESANLYRPRELTVFDPLTGGGSLLGGLFTFPPGGTNLIPAGRLTSGCAVTVIRSGNLVPVLP